MTCRECGFANPDHAKFCSGCGRAMTDLYSEFVPTNPFGDPRCIPDRRPHHLDMLLRSSACINKTMDLDHFLDVAIAELVNSMEVEAVGILLYETSSSDFHWRAVHDPKGVLSRRDPEGQGGVHRKAIEEAIETGEPVLTGNGPFGSSSRTDATMGDEGSFRNALVVPLNTREKAAGALVLVNKKAGGFIDKDVRACLSLAGIVAMSAENEVFFDELLDSYKKVLGLDRIKSKILNRLSHELRTPLAIMKASLMTMESKLGKRGIAGFEAAFERLYRQIQNLGRLELQVESIMMRGYAEEREIISGLLESAAALIEVQAEQTPEIASVTSMMLTTLQEALPAHHEQWERIDVKEFGHSVFEYVLGEVEKQDRHVTLECDFRNGSAVLIPDLVLHGTLEGMIRNAVEATPDQGRVSIQGHLYRDLYTVTIEDTGIGIPEEDWGLVFDGFYQVQETEFYTTGRPYSFNAGGKGMDLFRIKMFSRIYGFGLYFKSRRCEHLTESQAQCPGKVDRCPSCKSLQDCANSSGTVFQVELPVAGA